MKSWSSPSKGASPLFRMECGQRPCGRTPLWEELKEIRSFGARAIPPLSKYLESSDLRAQTLAVNLVGAIGGKIAMRPLSYAADRCTSAVARLAAVENLGQQPWADVVNVIERVSA